MARPNNEYVPFRLGRPVVYRPGHYRVAGRRTNRHRRRRARRDCAVGKGAPTQDPEGAVATALFFLTAAGGRIDDNWLTSMLTDAGRSRPDRANVHPHAITSAADHVLDALHLIGASDLHQIATDAGRVLARAASGRAEEPGAAD